MHETGTVRHMPALSLPPPELVSAVLPWADVFAHNQDALYTRQPPVQTDSNWVAGKVSMSDLFYDFVSDVKPLFVWRHTQPISEVTNYDDLSDADVLSLIAALGAALRSERFQEGLLADLIEAGWFARWFDRLAQLCPNA